MHNSKQSAATYLPYDLTLTYPFDFSGKAIIVFLPSPQTATIPFGFSNVSMVSKFCKFTKLKT